MTELVLDTNLNDSQREYLGMVIESGDALLALVNDILDFSKIEAGKLDFDHEVFDLEESLGDTMKSLAYRAHSKGLELACRIHPDVPTILVGDIGRLRQVVVNLVGNAIKFTDRGEVVLDVSRQSMSKETVELLFRVTDTGIGISPEKLLTVFEAFEQADSSTTRRFGGTGLGLAICHRLVSAMGGEIWVKSQPGRGSEFYFTAQIELAPRESLGPVQPRPVIVSGTRVLVVDDNATNRIILEEMLTNWGMKPMVVPDVASALGALRESFRAGESFTLVLTDANMPQYDGFVLAQRIKQDPELSSTVIMMLTSGDRPGDVARCEELGISAYLLKPVKQSELFDAIVVALGVTAAEDECDRAMREIPAELPPLRILLAEDSLVNQRLAVGLLERQGHSVAVANHGREALAAFESGPYDLILMDVQMPEMDGFDATAAIRAREAGTGRRVPIVAMTAHAMKGDRQRCLDAGMDDYIAKPIRARQLFQTIAGALGFSTPAATASVLPDNENGRGPTPGLAGQSGPPWDQAAALESLKDDRDLLRIVIETFLEETPQLTARLRKAVAESDAAQLNLAAHTLKGTLRFLAAEEGFQLALQLEMMAREAQFEQAPRTFQSLEDHLARLTASLSAYLEDCTKNA